uniref:Arf gtpase-activating protein n=1 Tax=Rhizophora mucronata TaxID=61149 RepID=A0A2P2JJ72_RHIMU
MTGIRKTIGRRVMLRQLHPTIMMVGQVGMMPKMMHMMTVFTRVQLTRKLLVIMGSLTPLGPGEAFFKVTVFLLKLWFTQK